MVYRQRWFIGKGGIYGNSFFIIFFFFSCYFGILWAMGLSGCGFGGLALPDLIFLGSFYWNIQVYANNPVRLGVSNLVL